MTDDDKTDVDVPEFVFLPNSRPQPLQDLVAWLDDLPPDLRHAFFDAVRHEYLKRYR